MDRKKELKEEYRRMKPAMGVFSICSQETNKHYLEGTTNLKAAINRSIFQLNFGSHPNQDLQRDWNKQGEASFTVTIIDELPYSENETPKHYKEEVLELKEIWQEKFRLDGLSFY
ncbi:MAG: GIY-YIG nuclease family protein [Limnochordia bacterium]|jgi:hypothetical protein|nr:GIY-YIG nuclease family protein [Limnochordia bacterium]